MISKETTNYIQNNFSKEEQFFFSLVGFSNSVSAKEISKKFTSDTITFKVLGQPIPNQERFLFKTIYTLNNVLQKNTLLYVPDKKVQTHITIRFYSPNEMLKNFPKRYQPRAKGYCFAVDDSEASLDKVQVIVMAQRTLNANLNSVLLCELTRALGIFSVSEFDQKSIFTKAYRDTSYGPMDLACLKILYNSGLQPGVRQYTFEEAMGISDEQIVVEQTKVKKRDLFDVY